MDFVFDGPGFRSPSCQLAVVSPGSPCQAMHNRVGFRGILFFAGLFKVGLERGPREVTQTLHINHGFCHLAPMLCREIATGYRLDT